MADEVLDLGELQGPVLVFGGAYSNLQALEAMLSVAKQLGIPSGNIIHTGDVVAYCAQPRETTDLLKNSGVHCLMGNCEESIGTGKLDCGCGFPEDSACNEYSINWYAHVMRELDGHDHLRHWMGSLPRRIEFVVEGRRLAVLHGSARNISEFLFASTPAADLEANFEVLPPTIDGIVAGHSGIPFARLLSPASSSGRERLWLNAGVIGMPANDGTMRGWYALLTPSGSGDLKVTIHALAYEARTAAEAITACPELVRGYADSLVSGVWPSHDILPLEEQMSTGVPLEETTLVWRRRLTGAGSGSRAATGLAAYAKPPCGLLSTASVGLAAAVAIAVWHRGRAA